MLRVRMIQWNDRAGSSPAPVDTRAPPSLAAGPAPASHTQPEAEHRRRACDWDKGSSNPGTRARFQERVRKRSLLAIDTAALHRDTHDVRTAMPVRQPMACGTRAQ